MVNTTTFNLWLCAWIACMALILYGQRREGAGSGLVISYVLQLWLIHWLAAVIYAFPWYNRPSEAMALGLEQSTYAIAGFALGSTAVLPALRYYRRPPRAPLHGRQPVETWLARACLITGVVMYFVLEPLLHPIPTISAIAAASSNLLLVAIAMECWNGMSPDGHRRPFWPWVASAAVLPFVTIVTKGFLGYGFASMLTIFAFVATVYRPRWRLVAGSALVGYLALSLYVTYMRDRRDIRAVVWGGEAYASRFSAFSRTLTEFEFLDIQNRDHLGRIDERLNQNFLVGRSVEYLEVHPDRFAEGRTLWEAVWSLVPRSLWLDKPIVAGSGDLVSEFTGIYFDKNTSVGIGHIMEWYVNFGTVGVIVGMTLLGALVGFIDRAAAMQLARGDGAAFVLYWLPGLSLLQVGGSLVEAVSSAAAGLVIGAAVYWFDRSRPRRHYAMIDAQPRPTLRPTTAGRQ